MRLKKTSRRPFSGDFYPLSIVDIALQAAAPHLHRHRWQRPSSVVKAIQPKGEDLRASPVDRGLLTHLAPSRHAGDLPFYRAEGRTRTANGRRRARFCHHPMLGNAPAQFLLSRSVDERDERRDADDADEE